jgi:pyrroloquinoline quinone biosynthesis protein D
MVVGGGTRPILPRHARLKLDGARGVWLLLAPERVLTPDAIAVEVLQLCDGTRTVAAIAGVLGQKYAAPPEQIVADVAAMLQDLADKGFLSEMHEEPK